jgi:hypothetical protein
MNNKNQYKLKNGINKEWKRNNHANKVDKIQSIYPVKYVPKTNASINKESKKEIIDPDYIPIWMKKHPKNFLLNECVVMTVITKEQNQHFYYLLNFIKKQHPYILIEHIPDYSIRLKNLRINYTLTIIYEPMKWFMITHIENINNILNISCYSKNYYDTYNIILGLIHK